MNPFLLFGRLLVEEGLPSTGRFRLPAFLTNLGVHDRGDGKRLFFLKMNLPIIPCPFQGGIDGQRKLRLGLKVGPGSQDRAGRSFQRRISGECSGTVRNGGKGADLPIQFMISVE
jgi:hypothetical protein